MNRKRSRHLLRLFLFNPRHAARACKCLKYIFTLGEKKAAEMVAWHTRVDHHPEHAVLTLLFHREGEMSRKIFRSGNSLVVTLPKDMLAYLRLGEGDEVHLGLDPERRQIVIKPPESPVETSAVDREFASQVADFVEKYRTALEELAR